MKKKNNLEKQLGIKGKAVLGNEWLCVVAIYIVSTVFRFLIGNYFKTIHVYGDDLVYYQMAESFAHGLGFRISNVEWPYRILYSIFIAPAFFFKDRHMQMSVIQFINSALISSTIFPYAIMIQKVMRKRKTRAIAYIFFVIYADLCYSMTFMSENLLLPLGTWIICMTMLYVWDETVNKRIIGDKPVLAIVLGVLLYLGYMNKNSAIILIPMTVGMICADSLWLCIKNTNYKVIIPRIIDIVIILAVFFLLKKTGDHNWMYLNEEVVYKTEKVKKELNLIPIIQSTIYLLVTAIIGLGVLPAFLPMVFFSKLNNRNKKLYTFVIIMFGVGILAVGWYNKLKVFDVDKLRPHFRYVIYIWLPALICFFSLMEEKLNDESMKKALLFAIPVMMCSVIFKGTHDGSTVDQTINYYIIRFLDDRIFLLKAALVIVAALTVPMIIRFQKQTFVVFLVFFCGIQLVNNALVIKYHHQDYYLDDNTYEQIAIMEDRIRNDKQHNYLIIADETELSKYQRLSDTFFNMANVYSIYYNKYVNNMNNRTQIPTVDKIENRYGYRYSDLNRIDYIIMPIDSGFRWDETMMTELPEYENSYWKMYAVTDTNAFPQLYK